MLEIFIFFFSKVSRLESKSQDAVITNAKTYGAKISTFLEKGGASCYVCPYVPLKHNVTLVLCPFNEI